VSNDRNYEGKKYLNAGLYFCNSKMNPGIACATKRESIEYFKSHLAKFFVAGIEQYIDFSDFVRPLKFKP
jgi:hypothetical protein